MERFFFIETDVKTSIVYIKTVRNIAALLRFEASAQLFLDNILFLLF